MRLGERLVVFILRPIYRTFFDRLVWWFLLKVKIFMLADIREQLERMEARLQSDDSQQRWAAMEARLRSMEAGNAAQWDALEQLHLALFRQPESQSSEEDTEAPQYMAISSDTKKSRTHAASNLR